MPQPIAFLLRGILTAVALWVAAIVVVYLGGAWPQVRNADAILVLGAAQYNGRPSPVLKARVDHALALYRQGYAPRIIFTGGVGRGDTLSEGEVARRYAIDKGVADSAILVERQGVTSAESVAAAAALMRTNGLLDALLVSDSYHMLRLELLARRSGVRGYRAPTPSAPIDAAGARTRWHYLLRESVLFPATAVLGGR